MEHVMLKSFLFCLNIGILTKAECNNTHPDQSGKLNCCTHFFLYNGECKECPPGFFGDNCSRQCYYPYYGRLCLYMCQCDNNTCDHVIGCTNNTSMDASTKG
ncbi:multiple epidermal growth factor-like domains protein 10 [Saccostrea echinata]|uniref:multiple epidermal growth factor-like domains protein 10 n=1 Tax=Saccostrea echinata TaxID=191078 RepID=UPI002A81A96D|nr:multiple epidermal growth factor-like domains protein 10 [Saccostrea echinata]